MKPKKWLAGVAVAAAVVVVVVAALVSKPGSGEEGPIRIGAILPLTGRAALLGENVRHGMELAIEDANANGGINGRMLEIDFGDSKNDPKEGVSLMNRYTAVDRLPVVVSAMTPITAPLIPIADRTKTVLFATMVSSPDFADKSPYLFRCFTRAQTEVPPLAALARNDLNLQAVATLFVDDDFGQGYSAVFKQEFKKAGGEIVGEIPYARGGSDFRNTLVKLKSIEADAIYLVGYDKAMGLIPKQLREMGVDTRILANASAATPAYTQIAGEAAEGIVLMSFAFSTRAPGTEEGKQLIERYREKFGDTPLVLTVIGYDIVGLLVEAMRNGGCESDQVREELLKIVDHSGVIGKLSVDANGEADLPLMPLVIRGGKPTSFQASKAE